MARMDSCFRGIDAPVRLPPKGPNLRSICGRSHVIKCDFFIAVAGP